MTRSQILYSPKSISQSQIENSVKAMKTISLYIKNGLVLQNDGLGIHSDKIWEASTTKNTLKYLKKFSPDLTNWPKYLRYVFLKKLSLGVHELNFLDFQIRV